MSGKLELGLHPGAYSEPGVFFGLQAGGPITIRVISAGTYSV